MMTTLEDAKMTQELKDERAAACRSGFEEQRQAGINVDWFTWQIAWHDALFAEKDAAQPPAVEGTKLTKCEQASLAWLDRLCAPGQYEKRLGPIHDWVERTLAAPTSSASGRAAEDASGDEAVGEVDYSNDLAMARWLIDPPPPKGAKLYTRPAPANQVMGLTSEQCETIRYAALIAEEQCYLETAKKLRALLAATQPSTKKE